MMACELCDQAGGELLFRDDVLRVVLVADADYPGFCRVILNAHVPEMTDLEPALRNRLMQVVFAVEDAVRQVMQPTKINLACFGNVVPHLHWHVIPRHADDAHFPQPVWGARQREVGVDTLHARASRLPALRTLLADRLAGLKEA